MSADTDYGDTNVGEDLKRNKTEMGIIAIVEFSSIFSNTTSTNICFLSLTCT